MPEYKSTLMKKLRKLLYNASLRFGLFYLMPVVNILPKPFAIFLLKLKLRLRFAIGSYMAYINRPGLKEIALQNLINTLGLDEKTAHHKLYRLMQLEIFAERHGFCFDKYLESDIANDVTILGIENLNNELKKGKGIVFSTIHSGDNELFILLLALKGYNIYGLYDGSLQHKKTDNPLEEFAQLKDSKISGKVGKLYTGKGFRGVFRALSENGIILWMVDLPAGNAKRKTLVNFMGRKIGVDNTFWESAYMTGAALLPYINIYDPVHDKHTIHIGTPIDFTKNTIQDIYCFYESHVKNSPESWLGWYILDLLTGA